VIRSPTPAAALPRPSDAVIMTPDTLLKTDKCTIAVEAAPEGKIRVLTTAWAEPVVILADQVLEVRIRQGQVHILRKPRVKEAADHPPTGFEGAESNA
jgi:hypothetical protein